jgi:hypothetical protein
VGIPSHLLSSSASSHRHHAQSFHPIRHGDKRLVTRSLSLSLYNDGHDGQTPLKNRSHSSSSHPGMSSYLRSWFAPAPVAPPPPPVPEIAEHEPELDDDDADTITIKGPDDDDYDDTPPAFPAFNSAQRAISSSSSHLNGPPRILSNRVMGSMPPPPVPGLAKRTPGVPTPSSLSVPSTPSTLALPTSTTKRPKVSRKVQLAPGHGALDWANLKNSGKDLRVCVLGRLLRLSFPHRDMSAAVGRE